ncbi:hypothetical protein LB534_00630 [Mesorhizobium sp. CA18]|uniref:hypothetical protein n=1 Tax=unclassified Mesorhizobium TaxID=325217 RepID=UPI001CCDD57A|nr:MULTISPECIES: hypothetical protein [unclassified Mesorhizobium]MBZ9732339.1 hypothetical protein [Mesorhizobium sp. CA9]MBZ9823778.1 hypothetical protein [Mesorhizobium sp. CA18]MBZ9830006.1 hypothetical protein [Mesorhizobium sp. CA2]MBZ9835896.1 hypothetical protein [Mesorhizobium sp. CA3]MBZ9875420.1 hypothetical protein [Mesorhizobium sp. Ca11]
MGNSAGHKAPSPGQCDVNEHEDAASVKPGGVEFQLWMPIASGDEAEAGSIHGAGLAGHGLGETLTLESGRQVHFAAGEQAGKKLHHHLHSVAQTGRLRLMEWGSSFAAVDIGSLQQKLNRKSEALVMKSDIICDVFRRGAQNFR